MRQKKEARNVISSLKKVGSEKDVFRAACLYPID